MAQAAPGHHDYAGISASDPAVTELLRLGVTQTGRGDTAGTGPPANLQGPKRIGAPPPGPASAAQDRDTEGAGAGPGDSEAARITPGRTVRTGSGGPRPGPRTNARGGSDGADGGPGPAELAGPGGAAVATTAGRRRRVWPGVEDRDQEPGTHAAEVGPADEAVQPACGRTRVARDRRDPQAERPGDSDRSRFDDSPEWASPIPAIDRAEAALINPRRSPGPGRSPVPRPLPRARPTIVVEVRPT